MLVLLVNFIAYAFLLICSIKQKKYIISNIYCLSLWFLGALFSIFYYFTPFFQEYNKYRQITILPFLYLFVLFVLFYNGIKLNQDVKKVKWCKSPIVYPLILIISISAYLPFFEHIRELLFGSFSLENIADIKQDYYNGDIDIFYYMSPWGARFNSIAVRFSFVIPILLFYYLVYWKSYNKIVLIGLVLSVINPVLQNMIVGGRGSLVQTAIYFVLVFMFFRNLLQEKIRVMMKKIMLFLGLAALGAFIVTTIFRFTSSNYEDVAVSDWFIRYFGESFCNFNTECWYFKNITLGHNTLAYFIEDDGLRNYLKLESVTGIRMNVYFTMFGDILLDFGYYITPLIFVLLFFLGRMFKPQNGIIDLPSLFIFSLLSFVFIQGLFIWPLINKMNAAVTTIVLYFVVKLTKPQTKKY